jgi:hypothetical protein
MSEKPISQLRRRMIEDMTVRNFVEKTRNDYIRHVRSLLGRSPDTTRAEDLRRFQLHQTQTGVRPLRQLVHRPEQGHCVTRAPNHGRSAPPHSRQQQ